MSWSLGVEDEVELLLRLSPAVRQFVADGDLSDDQALVLALLPFPLQDLLVQAAVQLPLTAGQIAWMTRHGS